ncbi:MAG: sel1 repeat family protein, partial [Rhizobiales bacterium]|nr:sel1 repeat family protein [Hyphomicrobiales bacterium]
MSFENPAKTRAEITPHGATAGMLYELGLMFCNGSGQNYVTAHKWFNLAALKGSHEAKLHR